MARSGGKVPLWSFWILATIISGLFVILCLVTFVNMAEIQYDTAAGRPGSNLNGAMAAALMSAILVTLLCIVAFMILVRKTWTQSGTGFSYGFLDASYLFTSFFTMLAGVVLTAEKHGTNQWEQSNFWAHSATNAYVATYVFAFITSGVYLLTFLALILYRRAVQDKELTMDEVDARLRSSQMSHMAEAPAAPPAGVPPSRSAPGGGAWSAGV